MSLVLISGFACPSAAWKGLFPDQLDSECITLSRLLGNAELPEIFSLAKAAEKEIVSRKPATIILHDIGVTVGLIALLKIRKADPAYLPKIILFNGAFRGFNVLKSTHPIRIQLMSLDSIRTEVHRNGGEFDSQLGSKIGKIKALYRNICLGSLLGITTKKTPVNSRSLGKDMLVLASPTDPYISMKCLNQIVEDFPGATMKIVPYGHFPYRGNIEQIKAEIDLFLRGYQ